MLDGKIHESHLKMVKWENILNLFKWNYYSFDSSSIKKLKMSSRRSNQNIKSAPRLRVCLSYLSRSESSIQKFGTAGEDQTENYARNLHKICFANTRQRLPAANAEITRKSCCDNDPPTLVGISRDAKLYQSPNFLNKVNKHSRGLNQCLKYSIAQIKVCLLWNKQIQRNWFSN